MIEFINVPGETFLKLSNFNKLQYCKPDPTGYFNDPDEINEIDQTDQIPLTKNFPFRKISPSHRKRENYSKTNNLLSITELPVT